METNKWNVDSDSVDTDKYQIVLEYALSRVIFSMGREIDMLPCNLKSQ